MTGVRVLDDALEQDRTTPRLVCFWKEQHLGCLTQAIGDHAKAGTGRNKAPQWMQSGPDEAAMRLGTIHAGGW